MVGLTIDLSQGNVTNENVKAFVDSVVALSIQGSRFLQVLSLSDVPEATTALEAIRIAVGN